MSWFRNVWRWVASRVPQGPRYTDGYFGFWVIHNVWISRSYYAVAKLGVADLLLAGPLSVADIAAKTGTVASSLDKVLRLMAAYDVFRTTADGRYTIGRWGHELVTDHPKSTRWWAVSMGDESFLSTTKIMEALKQGGSAFSLAHGKNLWEYFQEHPDSHKNFVTWLDTATNAHHCPELAQAFDYKRFGSICDIGGGRGALVLSILEQWPHLQAALFDQPATIEQARPFVAKRGMQSRLKLVAGNFLEDDLPPADAYVIKHVLRDWSDDFAVKILSNAARAMTGETRLLVIEGIVDPRDRCEQVVKLLDVQLFFDMGGGLRTLDQWRNVFERAGLELIQTHPTRVLDGHYLELRKKASARS